MKAAESIICGVVFLFVVSVACAVPTESQLKALISQESVGGRPLFSLARYTISKPHIILNASRAYEGLATDSKRNYAETILRKLANQFSGRTVSVDVISEARIIVSADYLPGINHIKITMWEPEQNTWKYFASLINEEPGSTKIHRCEICGKMLGKEVPESALSKDSDFKQHGMFQVCQHCLDKTVDRDVQKNYTRLALKYKWNSIAHNETMEVKIASAAYRARQEMLAREKSKNLLASH